MRSILAIFFCVVFAPALLYAQENTRDHETPPVHSMLLRGVPMVQALEELVNLSGIDLVYTSDLVSGRQVYCSERHALPEDLLTCILKGSGLDYIRSSAGTYVIISSLEAPPLFGDLAGTITDVDTGAPLPYANVLLADASAGTTTNQDGLFQFPALVTGMHRLIITYIGYETSVDTIWVEAGKQNKLQIQLQQYDLSVGPIVVNGLEHRLPSGGLGSGALSAQALSRMSAIGTSDAIRSAGRIAGVGVQQPLAALHIQGSDGNEHVTLLDGTPVRNPVSMGRHLGAFSPLALERLTVHKAGFGTRYGSNLTGYVAVDHDMSSPEPYSAAMMIDPISSNLRIKSRVGLSNNREATWMAAFRTSNWDVYQDRGVQTLLRHWNAIDPLLATFWAGQTVNRTTFNRHSQQPSLNFSDLHMAFRYKANAFQSLSGSLYRASNRLASDLIAFNQLAASDSDLFILTQDRYSWLNWAGQLRHSWLLGARSVVTTQIKGSWHNSAYAYGALRNAITRNPSDDLLDDTAESFQDSLRFTRGSKEKNVIREYTLSSTLSHSFSPHHHAEIGLETSYAASEFAYGSGFVEPLDYLLSASQLAGYVQDEVAINAFLTIEPGVRVTYVPIRQTVYAEPRLALRFDGFDDTLGNFAFRLAGGVYRQFINQFDLTSLGTTSAVPSILFWLPVDRSLAPPRAYHLNGNLLLTPSEAWSIAIESYIKWQPRLLTIDYATIQSLSPTDIPLRQAHFIAKTSGRAYGASMQLRRSGTIVKNAFQYSFSRSLQRFPGRFQDNLLPSPWNVPHRLALDVAVQLAEPLHAEVNWISEWGRTWAFRRAYYDFLAPRNLPVSYAPFELESPENDRTPAYHRLDLGISYKVRSAGRINSMVQLFVVNVLDRDNVYDQSFEPNGSTMDLMPRTLPGRQFSLSLRVDY